MHPSQNPIENPSLSARPTSRKGGLIRYIRSSVLLAVSLAALEGCATFGRSPQQNAMAAYDEGQYLEAKAFYKEVPEGKLTDEDRERRENIDWAIGGMASYYLAQAEAATGNKLEQRNNYFKAIENLESAFRYLGEDHPNRKLVEREIADIHAKLALFAKEYEAHNKTLRDWLGSRKADDEKLLADISVLFEQIRIRRFVLFKAGKSFDDKAGITTDERPYNTAVEYAKVYYKAGKFKEADRVVEIANAMDLSELNFGKSQITEGHKKFFALIRVIKTHLTKEHQEKVRGLVSDMQKALAENRYDEVRRKGDEIRNMDAANPSVTRILEEMEIRLNPVAKPKAIVARKAYVAPAPKGPSPDEIAANEEAAKDAEALQAADSTLDQLSKDFESGKVFEAIVGIDKAIRDLQVNRHVDRLVDQRKKWEGSRKGLIDNMLVTAGNLVGQRNLESFKKAKEIYKDVLIIDPKNQAALEKIQTLDGLQPK